MPSKPPIDIGFGADKSKKRREPEEAPKLNLPLDVRTAEPGAIHPQLATLMRKRKLTPKGQEKFMQELLAAMTAMCGAQFVQSLFEGVLRGDHRSMKMFAESTALIKAPGGINISMQQNNQNTAGDKVARVSFESIARELTTQHPAERVIEATPVREVSE